MERSVSDGQLRSESSPDVYRQTQSCHTCEQWHYRTPRENWLCGVAFSFADRLDDLGGRKWDRKGSGRQAHKVERLNGSPSPEERQVSSQLQRLRSGGYIRLRRTPYGYSIEVLKSKKFINRDRQRSAEHDGSDQQQVTNPDQHKIADHEVETSNKLQQRSAIICRNKEDLTVDYKKQREESKKPILPRSKVSDPRIKELTESWAALYLTRCGEGYPFTKKDFGQFENALRQFDVPRLKELAAQFFATADPWIKEKAGFTVGVFVSRLASLASISAAKLNGHKPAELKEMTL
jgi:hypothetical protein